MDRKSLSLALGMFLLGPTFAFAQGGAGTSGGNPHLYRSFDCAQDVLERQVLLPDVNLKLLELTDRCQFGTEEALRILEKGRAGSITEVDFQSCLN